MARKAEEVASVISQAITLVRSRIPVSKAFLFGSYLTHPTNFFGYLFAHGMPIE